MVTKSFLRGGTGVLDGEAIASLKFGVAGISHSEHAGGLNICMYM